MLVSMPWLQPMQPICIAAHRFQLRSIGSRTCKNLASKSWRFRLCFWKPKVRIFLNLWARLRRFYILFDENLNFWTTLQVLTPRARNVKTRTRCDHIRKKFWISPSSTLRKMLLKDLLPTLSTTLFSSHNFIPISDFNSILKFLSPIVQ